MVNLAIELRESKSVDLVDLRSYIMPIIIVPNTFLHFITQLNYFINIVARTQ